MESKPLKLAGRVSVDGASIPPVVAPADAAYRTPGNADALSADPLTIRTMQEAQEMVRRARELAGLVPALNDAAQTTDDLTTALLVGMVIGCLGTLMVLALIMAVVGGVR